MATNDNKKGMNTNSNAYTIIYAVVLVVIVAFLLAFVSSVLKPIQDENVENDTKGQILTSMGYDKDSVDVKKMFADSTVVDYVFNKETKELELYKDNFLSSYGAAIKEGKLHVFVGKAKNGQEAYVIPVTGRGLWGGLWGYIALSFETGEPIVVDTYFYHESETAGLGARIGDRDFQKKFIGKPIYENGKIALTVVKDGASKADTQIDGVTGATLTSKGVGAMVKDGLRKYEEFIQSKMTSISPASNPEIAPADDAMACGGVSQCQGCPNANAASCANEAGCSEKNAEGCCAMKQDGVNVEQKN